MKSKPIVLVIEDELAIRRLLRAALEHESYRVCEADNAQLGLQKTAERRPDVMILDLDLPDVGGWTVLQSLREWSLTPVLVLSARTGTADKVRALDSGAIDYLTKPFDTVELLARLRVLQRNAVGFPDGPLLIEGDLQVNLTDHQATFKGRKLNLTPTEEAVFYLLVQFAGKVVTCKHLLRSVWGTDAEHKTHDLQVYIAQLRKKLGDTERQIVIRTEGRIGYQLLTAASQNRASATAADLS